MYFITKQDPNYTVKGSRDPLGFQVIWQASGRKLIPYLSTVSGSVKDFQILSTAYFYKHELNMDDESFERFFILFEQLMAYTRYQLNGGEGFNGVDRVKRIFAVSSKEVRISMDNQILSNQRAYGIWGKYIRPFTDMGIKEAPKFNEVYKDKIGRNQDLLRQAMILKKKGAKEAAYVQRQKLDVFADILAKPEEDEKALYISKLLSDECGGELLRLFSADPKLKKLLFYDLLTALSEASDNIKLKTVLGLIQNTEKVLSPLNRIFRYLQSQSFWKKSELDGNPYITRWRSEIDVSGFTPELKELAALLSLSNWELVQRLVQRNERICSNRGSAPWVKLTSSGLEVNHFEGALFWKDYDPARDWDNTYFLSTYINLHNQLN
jgi:hypothetical protein